MNILDDMLGWWLYERWQLHPRYIWWQLSLYMRRVLRRESACPKCGGRGWRWCDAWPPPPICECSYCKGTGSSREYMWTSERKIRYLRDRIKELRTSGGDG